MDGHLHRWARGPNTSDSMVVMVDFEMTDVHNEAAVSELRERLVAFNIAATGYDEYRSLSCVFQNDEGELDAGIDGFSWGGYAMVEWLWVTAPIRGRVLEPVSCGHLKSRRRNEAVV